LAPKIVPITYPPPPREKKYNKGPVVTALKIRRFFRKRGVGGGGAEGQFLTPDLSKEKMSFFVPNSSLTMQNFAQFVPNVRRWKKLEEAHVF
jgi:hypothetical protein